MFITYFLISITLLSILLISSLRIYQLNRKRKDLLLLKLTYKWNSYLNSVLNEENTSLTLDSERSKQLESSENLMAFFRASENFVESNCAIIQQQFARFIQENKKNWICLAKVYEKKNTVPKAYFAFVSEKLRLNRSEEYDELTEIMIRYASEPSVYCRENALKALYAFGNVDAIVDVFLVLSEKKISHHRKLITDGLIGFTGNTEKLSTLLFSHLDSFSLPYQIAIVDYFRFSGGHLKERMITLIENPSTDKDLVCSVLRFYQKYPVEKFKNIFLSYLEPSRIDRWECSSTAALTLAKYPGEDTLTTLKSALTSKYWYVRLNAARAIADLEIEEERLKDILQGQDDYAKEQLLYHMTNKQEKSKYNGSN